MTNTNVDFNSTKKETWKTTAIAVFFFVLGMFIMSFSEVKAQGACFTPSMLEAQIASAAERENTVVTMNKWDGEDAQAIRNYIQTQVPNEIIPFDTVMTVIREGYSQALIMVFKDGCSVFVTTIPSSEIQKYKDVVRGT
jgi:hypothetical protein